MTYAKSQPGKVCADRLNGVTCQCDVTKSEAIILPLCRCVKPYLKSYPQSYPHNSLIIAIVYGVIHRLINRQDIDEASFSSHAKKKTTLVCVQKPLKSQALPKLTTCAHEIQCSEWIRFLVRQWGHLRMINEYLYYFYRIAWRLDTSWGKRVVITRV